MNFLLYARQVVIKSWSFAFLEITEALIPVDMLYSNHNKFRQWEKKSKSKYLKKWILQLDPPLDICMISMFQRSYLVLNTQFLFNINNILIAWNWKLVLVGLLSYFKSKVSPVLEKSFSTNGNQCVSQCVPWFLRPRTPIEIQLMFCDTFWVAPWCHFTCFKNSKVIKARAKPTVGSLVPDLWFVTHIGIFSR